MKPFKFSLQSILNIENIKKDQLTNLIIKKTNKIDSLEEQKVKYQELINNESNKIFNKGGQINVEQLRGYMRYKDNLTDKIKICNENILKLKKDLENERKKITLCNKKIDTLNKIKDRKKEEYILELNKEEEKQLQEYIQTKYTFKKQSKSIFR